MKFQDEDEAYRWMQIWLLAARSVEELLEAGIQGWRKADRPSCVEQADTDQIAQVSSVLVAPGAQFHSGEGLQFRDLEFGGTLGFIEVRRGDHVLGFDLFAGEEEVDAVAGSACRAVDEGFDIQQSVMDEAGGLEDRADRFEVVAANEDIDIARVTNRPLVNRRHPGRHGIAADHGIRQPRLGERRRRSQQPFAYLGHSSLHSVENFNAHADGPGRPARPIVLGWLHR